MDPAAQGTILADALLIDRVVRRFESAWRNGQSPQVDQFLDSLPPAHRSSVQLRLQAAARRLSQEEHQRALESEPAASTFVEALSPGPTPLSDAASPDETPDEATPAAAAAPMPQTLGAFQIKSELGRGAFGIVYQAYDSRLERTVAIKVPLLDSDSLRQLYIDEARKAARIECVGIVPIYHVDVTASGSPYVVQKYIDGPNLRELLKRVGRIRLQPALTIVRDIARTLATAHRSGMVHRDLKPENILLDEQGTPWIADFGLALREEEQDGREGEIAGTPLYMSPEQVRGKADWLDGRTDIWAAGVLMYELIAGRPPFAAKKVDKLIREICRRDPKPLTQRSAAIPVELDEIFSRCCAKKARDRYGSADELANHLDRVLQTIAAEGDTHDTHRSATGLLGGSTVRRLGDGAAGTSSGGAGASDPRQESPKDDRPSHESFGHESLGHESLGHESLGHDAFERRGDPVALQGAGSVRSSAPKRRRVPSLIWLWGAASLVAAASAATIVSTLSGPTPSEQVPSAYAPSHDPVSGSRSASGTTAISSTTTTARSAEAPIAEAPAEVLLASEPPPPPPIDRLHLVVSPEGGGTHRTIGEALRAVESGGEIQIRPGFYSESLKITKPVQLIGGEDPSQVVISSEAGPCLTIQGGSLAAERITFRGFGVAGQLEFNTIDVVEGSLQLSHCAVSASTFCCVKARGDTVVRLNDSSFASLTDSAVSCVGAAEVAIDGCTFRDCHGAAVELFECSGTITACSLLGNNRYGVYCRDTGEASVIVEDCKWEGCASAGVKAERGAVVEVTGGTLSRCKVSVEAQGGTVVLREVMISDGTGPAISVTEQGQLDAFDCELRSSMVGLALKDGRIHLTRCQILAMTYMGVFTKADSVLQMDDCLVQDCAETGMKLEDTRLTMSGGKVHNNGAGGIDASGNSGSLSLQNVTVSANATIGLHLTDGQAECIGGEISDHQIGVLIESSGGGAPASRFDAERLIVKDHSTLAFQFLAGTQGNLRACRSSGHPRDRALVVSQESEVLTDKECTFTQ